MIRTFLLFLLCGISFQSISAQSFPQKPKLIVHVVVEHMRYDYLTRFYSQFGDNGFKKIIQYGATCTNAHIPFAYATAPTAYASMSTGSVPSEHGIVGDVWYNRIAKKEVYPIHDKNYYCSGCSNKKLYQVSPKKLITTTFADELELGSQGKSKTYSIGLTPESSVLMAGRMADGVYWLDTKSGNWVTSVYYDYELPKWLVAFNKKKIADTYLKKTWKPKHPLSSYTESLPDDTEFEIGISDQITFPYNLSQITNKYSPYSILTQTPFGNTYTKDLAITTIEKAHLGSDSHTDYISIAFTALGEITNAYGSMSKEVEDCVIRLDTEIGFLVNFLESTLGKENFMLVLSSTSGVETPTEYITHKKKQGGTFKMIEAVYILEKHLETIYGKGPWIEYYHNNQIYLDRTTIAEKTHVPLQTVQQEASLFLQQLAGIQTVLTASDINKTGFTDNIKKRISNSYNQKRSGDIFIELMPGWSEETINKVAQHSSTYTETTHIPLIWYGWKIGPQIIHTQLYSNDIVPTLCEIIGIQRPNAAFGSYINSITE
ncbi:MAG: alkaline phosphatase family protein [Bacteroidales bacterium]